MFREGYFPVWSQWTVNERASNLKLSGNPLGTLQILRPNAGPKTSFCVVGAPDNILLCRPDLTRNDGTKWLFCHDPRVVRWVVDDRGLNEVAFAGVWPFGFSGDVVPLRVAVIDERSHIVKLHDVLNGSYVNITIEWITDFQRFGE